MLAMFRSLSEDKCIITEKDKKATKAQHTCVHWWAQVLKSTTASLWTHFHSDWSPVTTIEQSYIKTKCLYSFILLEVPKSADGFTCSWPFEASCFNCKFVVKSCSLSALLSQPKHLTELNWNPPFQEVFGQLWSLHQILINNFHSSLSEINIQKLKLH